MLASRTVFVIDNDLSARESLKVLLGSAGYSVVTCNSGQEFLNSYSPSYEGCLLLDTGVPGSSGLEVQKELVKKGASLPVIMMSRYGDVPTAVEALKAGAVDFIVKPFNDAAMINSVKEALDRGMEQLEEARSTSEFSQRAERLTPREAQVLDLLIEGLQNKVIGQRLGISPRTVEIYRARVMDKMQAESLAHLVRIALGAGCGATPQDMGP